VNVDFGALARMESELAELKRALPGMLEAAVRAALEQRDSDQVGGLSKLATWIGCPTADAARHRVGRDPDLAALAFNVGAQRRWRRSEVMALLAARRGGK
jgi:hypothetical protein